MSDEWMKGVEEELGGLKPAGLRPALVRRVGESVRAEEPWTWVDRAVAGFMGLSGVAAVFVVGVVVWQMMTPVPEVKPGAVQAREEMRMELERMLALR